MSDDPFEKFKFKIEDQPINVPPGHIYRPYIPLQVTPTFLSEEPDVIEKLAATVDPAIKARLEEAESLRRDREKWIKDVMRRHGKKIKLVKPEYFGVADVDNL